VSRPHPDAADDLGFWRGAAFCVLALLAMMGASMLALFAGLAAVDVLWSLR
jgi:hypothetical protein